MNTTKPNWFCYDASCAFCVRWANRFRALLERHGFTLLPLQSPTVRAALNLPEPELMAEMRVITPRETFGGADAFAYLSSVICQPIFWLTRIPGVMPLLRRAYRFMARNRGCAGNACQIRRANIFRVGNPVDWLPLLILGIAAAVIGKQLPPWLYMWTLAFALFTGCKWLCFRVALKPGAKVGLGRKLGFLFGWIGMDAAGFFTKPAEKPSAREFAFAAVKIFFGALLLWVATPRALAINPLLAGWTGMFGLILILHFGLFHLLSLAWRATGVNAPRLMRAPLLARSLGEFWGERWNTAFNKLVDNFLFRPMHRAVGARTATMLVFLASGLIHDLVISVPARGGYGLPTLYFLLQGTGVLFEHTRLGRRLGIHRGFGGWLFMFVVTAGPAFWLFHPPFIHNVMLPFLKYIGAT
ncbi:MAG TPA: DCC1-like thiol-disulfide oxidoreductase family protein [Verrucomicrobiae bacterium]|nr:DCC1-like thiol-disulfide oxidoreductase family protein [Verrucomicrobiae bacterium]